MSMLAPTGGVRPTKAATRPNCFDLGPVERALARMSMTWPSYSPPSMAKVQMRYVQVPSPLASASARRLGDLVADRDERDGVRAVGP